MQTICNLIRSCSVIAVYSTECMNSFRYVIQNVLCCIFKFAWFEFLIFVVTTLDLIVEQITHSCLPPWEQFSALGFLLFAAFSSLSLSLSASLSSLLLFTSSCHFSNFLFFRLLLHCMCACRTSCHRWAYQPTCTKRPRYPRWLVINSHVFPSFPV